MLKIRFIRLETEMLNVNIRDICILNIGIYKQARIDYSDNKKAIKKTALLNKTACVLY